MKTRLLFVVLVLAVFLGFNSSSYADNTIINVPEDFATIQEAINAAKDGDTIVVAEGTYQGNIYFKGKSLTLIADDSNVIIEGTEAGSVVTIDSDSTISGFIITSKDVDCRGIYVLDASPVIENCIITGNETTQTGAGIYFTNNSNPQIVETLTIGNDGKGEPVAGDSPDMSGFYAEGQEETSDSDGTEDLLADASTPEDTSEQTTQSEDSSVAGGSASGGEEPLTEPTNNIWYVDDNITLPPASQDGQSWETAFRCLQDALKNTDLTPGQEIRVARGTYTPVEAEKFDSISPTDREASFQLVNGVAVRGGYKGGTDADADERSINGYKTILSGDLNGDDLKGIPGSKLGDNSYHVVKTVSVNENTILDGFIITAGNANASSAVDWNNSGAGLVNIDTADINGVYASSPTIMNCKFFRNMAKFRGGAVFNLSGKQTFINCLFYYNESKGNGGAIYAQESSTELKNCVFHENRSRTSAKLFSGGAAIYLSGCNIAEPVKITNCTFAYNYNDCYHAKGEAIYCKSSNPIITNCIFWQDDIYVYSSSGSQNDTPTINYSSLYELDSNYQFIRTRIVGNGQGNSDSDPLLYTKDIFNTNPYTLGILDVHLKLQKNSPCIDLADGNEAPDNDILGEERIDIPGIGNDCDVPPADIGAYEYKKIRYVDASASLGGDGNSWNTAFRYLQDALYAAEPNTGEEKIQVAQGTYKPDQAETFTITPLNRSATFQLKSGIAVKGGYKGGENIIGDIRNIASYETILSGDLNGNDADTPDFPNFTTYGDNSYHVVVANGTSSNTILDGFTIRSGNADHYNANSFGGGLYNGGDTAGFPTVTNCIFKYNYGKYGGGAHSSSSLNDATTFTNCIFDHNASKEGGAIDGGNLKIVNCIFTNNKATSRGGAISGGDGETTNCTFYGNTAVIHGGAICTGVRAMTITNSIFWGNSDDIVGSPFINYCNVENPTTIGDNRWTIGIGNINTEPLFVDASNPLGHGLQLSSESLCIDEGADGVFVPTTDILGRERVDVLGVGDSIVDMGAYECQDSFAGITGTIYYVDEDAPDTPQDGESWGTAFKYLQDALDLNPPAGAWILVAEGTYSPDKDKDNGHSQLPTETFQLINGVRLYGGFAGYGAQNPDEQNPAKYQTVLHGYKSYYHVVTAFGTGPYTVLEGFTIVAGNAGGSGDNGYGGGLYNVDSSASIKRCVFTGDDSHSGNYAEKGAGVYNRNSSSLFLNCVFAGNSANEYGGGAYNELSSVRFINCVFVGNNAQTGAGIVFVHCYSNDSPAEVINCTIYDNTGEGIYNVNSNPTITNCILWDYYNNGTPEIANDANSTPTVTYCAIKGGYPENPDPASLDITNIDSYPMFKRAGGPYAAGDDGIFLTSDDGLRLKKGSPCSDVANDLLSGRDILGNMPVDNKIGIGFALADMGAYEGEEVYTYDESPHDLFAGGESFVIRYIGGADGKEWEEGQPDPAGDAIFTVYSFCEYDGYLYAGGKGRLDDDHNIAKVWRYDGDGVWNRVGNNLGIGENFRSSEVRALVIFQGKLHALVALYETTGHKGILYRYEGAGGTIWTEVAEFGSYDFTSGYVWNDVLYPGDDILYLGTDCGRIGYYYDGAFYDGADYDIGPIADFQVYNDKIYACGWNHVYEFDYKLALSRTWELYDAGAGDLYNLITRDLEVFQDKLYVAHGKSLRVLEGGYWVNIWGGVDDPNHPLALSPVAMTVTEAHPILGNALTFGMGYSMEETGSPFWDLRGPIYSYYGGGDDDFQARSDTWRIYTLIYFK